MQPATLRITKACLTNPRKQQAILVKTLMLNRTLPEGVDLVFTAGAAATLVRFSKIPGDKLTKAKLGWLCHWLGDSLGDYVYEVEDQLAKLLKQLKAKQREELSTFILSHLLAMHDKPRWGCLFLSVESSHKLMCKSKLAKPLLTQILQHPKLDKTAGYLVWQMHTHHPETCMRALPTSLLTQLATRNICPHESVLELARRKLPHKTLVTLGQELWKCPHVKLPEVFINYLREHCILHSKTVSTK